MFRYLKSIKEWVVLSSMTSRLSSKNLRNTLYSRTSRLKTTTHYEALLLDGEEGKGLKAVLNTIYLMQQKKTPVE